VPAREQTILMLRFHGNLPQAEIGARLPAAVSAELAGLLISSPGMTA
jgi:hypothetical protein